MSNSTKNISILGSTGSIGKNTLAVINNFPTQFNIIALSANTNIDLLYQQWKEFKPEYLVIGDYIKYKEFIDNTKTDNKTKVLYGEDGLIQISTLKNIDIVVNALVGFSGFIPTLEAIKHNKVCAIANKESLVVGGDLIMNEVKDRTNQILPIDSEHSAIHSLMRKVDKDKVNKLIITASGGPFRDVPYKDLVNVTLEQALNHPVWSMGKKITVDSSTMMNKGFEVIEAHHLFNFEFDKIETIIHKESTIHSMIETIDGEIYAQLSISDMRLPIQNALTYPEVMNNDHPRLSLANIKSLSFERMDYEKFPLLKLAYDVGKKGNSLPTVLNAANEVCVEKFLKREINYIDIYHYINKTIVSHDIIKNPTFKDIIKTDKWARDLTKENIKIKNKT